MQIGTSLLKLVKENGRSIWLLLQEQITVSTSLKQTQLTWKGNYSFYALGQNDSLITYNASTSWENSTHADVELEFDSYAVSSLLIHGLEKESGDLYFDEDMISTFAQSYAINPLLNFDYAEVTVMATGNRVYKCADWNYTMQECRGTWDTLMDVIPGQYYTFNITPTDPGFGEINITNATHLDENYTFIADIYGEVATLDDNWSDVIEENEIVRVIYERNLTVGNVVDIYLRTSGFVWLEIYKVGTSILTGISNIIAPTNGTWVYTTMNENTTGDEFDIVAKNGSVEYDFIHDANREVDGVFLAEPNAPQSISTGETIPMTCFWNETDGPGGPADGDIYYMYNTSSIAWTLIGAVTGINTSNTNPIIATVDLVNHSINITGNIPGDYNVRCRVLDTNNALDRNSTSQSITVAAAAPEIYFVNPTTNSSNLSQNFIQANVSAMMFANLTVYLYNSTALYQSNFSTVSPFYVNFSNLNDDTYYLNATAIDTGLNENYTETRTIILDTVPPDITFVPPTETSGTVAQRSNIEVNVTVTDDNFANMTIYLYNVTGLYNKVVSFSPNLYLNVTVEDGLYFFNATAEDSAMNYNATETRNITLDTTPPGVTIIYPQGETLDEDSAVGIAISIFDLLLDTILFRITNPVGHVETFTNGTFTLPSDDFETDTEGINWVKKNITAEGQFCFVDIDGTVPGAAWIAVNGNSGPSTAQCGYNSLKYMDGNFDVNISFNVTVFTDDTLFSFRSINQDTFFAQGPRVFVDIAKSGGQLSYALGWNNGGSTTQEVRLTDDAFGKMRIKRSNVTTGTPVFNLYYWNNTDAEWIDVLGDIQMNNSARVQYIQLKPASVGATYGSLGIQITEFNQISDDLPFVVYTNTSMQGRYNVTIIANDSFGLVNNSETTFFNISAVNDQPSRPFISSPNPDDVVTGITNITWSQVNDEEGDSLRFNISLLYVNGSFRESIVTNYGNSSSSSYSWNTSLSTEGESGFEITVYENETSEGLSNTDTLSGTIRVDNSKPIVYIDYPRGHNVSSNTDVAIVLNITEYGIVDTILANVTLPNTTIIPITNFDESLVNDSFTDNNTIGTNWEYRNDSIAPGHTCFTDIDETVSNSLFMKINGTATGGGSTVCGLNSLALLEGDFDIVVNYSAEQEDDSFFVLRINNNPSLLSAGIRVFISSRKTGGALQYRFAVVNSTAANLLTQSTTQTNGKFRIVRTNVSEGTPLISTYWWNNTGLDWVQMHNQTPLQESARAVHAHVYLESSEVNLGGLNATVPEFIVDSEEVHFGIYEAGFLEGVYNISVFVNDTVGFIADPAYSNFSIVKVNTPPSPPIIVQPSVGQFITGNNTIEWGIVTDAEDDPFWFNINLLYPNESHAFNITERYGNVSTTSYLNSSADYPDGAWIVEVIAQENNHSEENLSSSGTTGVFFIDNTLPNLTYIIPTNGSINKSGTYLFSANFTDNLNLSYANLSIYNQAGLYNRTQITLAGVTEISGVNVYMVDGIYEWNFDVSDLAYNHFTAENRTLLIDGNPPNITLISPANGTLTLNTTSNMTALLNDTYGVSNATLYVYNTTGLYNETTTDLGGILQTTIGITLTLVEGIYDWFYKATDIFGNSDISENRTIEVDTTAPTLSIISPLSESSPVVLIWTHIDSDGDNVIWWINDTNNMTYTTARYHNYSAGSHTLHAWANDSFGRTNMTNVSFEVEFNVTTTLISPQDGAIKAANLVDFVCEANSTGQIDKIEFYLNDAFEDEVNITGRYHRATFSETLADGDYNWTCISRSGFSNATTDTIDLEVNVALLPNYTNFNGTNFSEVPDIQNVCLATLDNGFDRVTWNNCINASQADFDGNVFFTDNNITVNTDGLDFTMNSSANLSFFNLPYPIDPVILRDGKPCVDVCSNEDYNPVTGRLDFTAAHFTTYTTESGRIGFDCT